MIHNRFISGFKKVFESFIVKEIKSPFPGPYLCFHTGPDTKGTPPFFDKHAFYSSKGVIVKEKHPLGRFEVTLQKNYKKPNHFESF